MGATTSEPALNLNTDQYKSGGWLDDGSPSAQRIGEYGTGQAHTYERPRNEGSKTPLPSFPLPHHRSHSLAQTLYLAASREGPMPTSILGPQLAPIAHTGQPRLDPFYNFRQEDPVVLALRRANDPSDPFAEWRPREHHPRHQHPWLEGMNYSNSGAPLSTSPSQPPRRGWSDDGGHHISVGYKSPDADNIQANEANYPHGPLGSDIGGVQRRHKGTCEVPGCLPGRRSSRPSFGSTRGASATVGAGYPTGSNAVSRRPSERLLPGPPLEPDPRRHRMADPSTMVSATPIVQDGYVNPPDLRKPSTGPASRPPSRPSSSSRPASASGERRSHAGVCTVPVGLMGGQKSSRPPSRDGERRSKQGICTVPLTMTGPLPIRT